MTATATVPRGSAALAAADPRLVRRRALVRTIAEARAELDRGFPELRAAVEEARQARDAADVAARDAAMRLRDAANALHGAQHVVKRRIRQASAELSATADPAIARLREEAEDQARWAARFWPLGTPRDAYAARLAELEATCRDIDGLEDLALTSDELGARLDALRVRLATLPGPPARPAA